MPLAIFKLAIADHRPSQGELRGGLGKAYQLFGAELPNIREPEPQKRPRPNHDKQQRQPNCGKGSKKQIPI